VTECYEWQVGQPRVEGWARKVGEEINAIKTGLHKAKGCTEGNKNHMPLYQTNLCCYPKIERIAEMRKSLLLYGQM